MCDCATCIHWYFINSCFPPIFRLSVEKLIPSFYFIASDSPKSFCNETTSDSPNTLRRRRFSTGSLDIPGAFKVFIYASFLLVAQFQFK